MSGAVRELLRAGRVWSFRSLNGSTGSKEMNRLIQGVERCGVHGSFGLGEAGETEDRSAKCEDYGAAEGTECDEGKREAAALAQRIGIGSRG
eukprot:6195794-Pleurochrysis_carterae.AAC.2